MVKIKVLLICNDFNNIYRKNTELDLVLRTFEKIFKIFWRKIDLYKPREYVKEKLSMNKSAKLYSKYYFNLIR